MAQEENIELEIDNYHKKSEKIEKVFFEEMLILLGPLIIALSNLTPLTKKRIDIEVSKWLFSNSNAINNLNNDQINKVKSIVNNIFNKNVVSEEDVQKYTKSNNELFENIVEDVKTRFQELATLEENYPMDENIKKDYINGIINHTEDKTEKFSTMSTTSTIRTMMFDVAVEHGFSEYQWHTQRDSRVRPAHAYMDTRWVKFDTPPQETGYYHVGQDWGCRCFADKFR